MFLNYWRRLSSWQKPSELTQSAKARRLAFRSVSVEGSSQYAHEVPYFVELLPGGSILATIIDGVWSEPVIGTLHTELSRVTTIDAASIRSAIGSCSDLIAERLRSLSEAESCEIGWSKIACGAVVFATSESCLCAWLGDTQVFLARQQNLVERNRPHTLFEEFEKSGNTTGDERLKNVMTRSFAHQPSPDFLAWSLQVGDLIVLANHEVPKSLIESAVKQVDLDIDKFAKSICENAHKLGPRIGYSIVAISANAS